MIIGIDALGGDFAPEIPVKAGVEAVNTNICKIALVGDKTVIENELKKYQYDTSLIEIVHAPEKIEMSDQILTAMRTKRKSSIRMGYRLYKENRINGFVSAGHSGAMLAIGKSVLKTIANIERPCISALMPCFIPNKHIMLADAGANMDCKPIHLFQFAVLGHIYMKHLHNIENPKIALLNVGAEEGKGDSLTKETYDYLKQSKLNFVGNIEGKEFFEGNADIIICDGFAGNVLLKASQGTYKFLRHLVEQELQKSVAMKFGLLLMLKALKKIKKRTDYSNYGGAPLLGLKGNSVVCHGGSNENAILTGIKFAKWASENNIIEKMTEKLKEETHNISHNFSTEGEPE